MYFDPVKEEGEAGTKHICIWCHGCTGCEGCKGCSGGAKIS